MIRAVCNTNYQYVIDGGHRSQEIAQSRGVAQGDKLSPLLFSLFIADMHYYLQEQLCDIIFYADDLVIGSDNLESVQNCLNEVIAYCHRNALRVNVSKTKAVKFRRGGQLARSDKLTVESQTIEFVNSFEYLGVVLSSRLAFSNHLEHLKNNATKVICCLAQKLDLRKINFNSAHTLMESVIYPSCSYAVEIFNHSDDYERQLGQHIDRVYGMFYKKWCGAPKWTSNLRLLSEIFINDRFCIKESTFTARRALAAFCNNGIHHKICIRSSCYRWNPNDCLCKFCNEMILDEEHIMSCQIFGLYDSPIEKMKHILYYC